MTDLDTLRRALRVPDEAAKAADPLDVLVVIEKGKRLRRRRRLAALAGGVCAAAAVFGAVTGVAGLARQAPAPARPAAPGPARPATPSPSSSPLPSSPRPSGMATPSAYPTAPRTQSLGAPTPSPITSVPVFPSEPASPSPTFSNQGPSPTFSNQGPTPSAAVHHADVPAATEPRSVDWHP